jgi:dTMP kinase
MLIAFTGCDGAGKSTLVENVRQELMARGHAVTIVDKWDIFDVALFPECRFIGCDLEELRVCIAEMDGISRALFLFWSIAIALTRHELHDPTRVFLLDGYWMKHAAAEIEYGCDESWVLDTVGRMPVPDLTIYLDVTPEVAVVRKKSFTPYECARRPDMDRGVFVSHQTRLRQRMLRWRDHFRWVTVSTTGGAVNVAAEVMGIIDARLRRVPSGDRLLGATSSRRT